jgi:hypothetical protein
MKIEEGDIIKYKDKYGYYIESSINKGITHMFRSIEDEINHVVVANSEEEVRQLAKGISADEGKDVWDNAKVEECGVYTCHRTEPFILLSDFRAG